ncbi:TPA_exp: Uncharacterized protein A8136_3373 [Trichophyton benhamiae CBS 112371]|uniref:Uncharacterized protein n=1 Tax=Arthroderma benhamiae (strain ATCC MYA-4681 / CBS 112371) TaxID=663331 RepID=D4B079_ARTBC|nr:uncharacterized protein ARB_01850 [Trichophyton benhamiae CBS 112371]EFE31231.1 hypothetical protein ARB_01850 [Trichophyton benhamiae CBS 112371]DAA74406.1 TPA_exp: Uncharacterized protein A8136_3373 [Trichophyton benhamiae CBS 112371]
MAIRAERDRGGEEGEDIGDAEDDVEDDAEGDAGEDDDEKKENENGGSSVLFLAVALMLHGEHDANPRSWQMLY